jgi:hypothetical protein
LIIWPTGGRAAAQLAGQRRQHRIEVVALQRPERTGRGVDIGSMASQAGTLAQPALRGPQAAPFGDPPPQARDALAQPLGVERLHEVVDGALLERGHRVLFVGRDEDDLRVRAHQSCRLHAVHAGHVHVQEDDVGLQLRHQVDGLAPVARLAGDLELRPQLRQVVRKVRAQQGLVVDDQGTRRSVRATQGVVVIVALARGRRRRLLHDGLRASGDAGASMRISASRPCGSSSVSSSRAAPP